MEKFQKDSMTGAEFGVFASGFLYYKLSQNKSKGSWQGVER
jgi:hypothetical protein